MKPTKEHKKSTLMRWSKEELVDYIMCLEHNINTLNESFDNQYHNCVRLLTEMTTVKNTYTEAKKTVAETLRKEEQNNDEE